MTEAALIALSNLLQPGNIAWLVLGVSIGLLVGIIPGLSGTVGLAILLPLVYGMEPTSAVAMMMGLLAVTQTSDTFPAVLLGVPGTSGSASTIVDGYPMTKKGLANQALGAAFTASLFGGLIGAAMLLLTLPIARPLILAVGSPELLMLTIFGLSAVGVISSGRSPLSGLLMVAFGLLLSSVGAATTAPNYRYTFDIRYLADGFSLVLVVLGLFAIPELIELIRRGVALAEMSNEKGSDRRISGRNQISGALEVFRHKWLVVRSAVVGAVLGAIPGVGGSAITWIVYGLTTQSYKDSENFGKGDIRGVIGPESANNANEGGGLIPTLMFGIPGSGSMAVVIGGLILVGVQPGPRMIQDDLPLVITIVWSLAFANIFGTLFCFIASSRISRITTVRPNRLVPFLFVAIMVAAYQSSGRPGDLIQVLVFGGIGWLCMRAGWSRAPLLIGFVLGRMTENYLWISIARFRGEFITRPGVISIGLMVLTVLYLGLSQGRRKARRDSVLRAEATVARARATNDDGGQA